MITFNILLPYAQEGRLSWLFCLPFPSRGKGLNGKAAKGPDENIQKSIEENKSSIR